RVAGPAPGDAHLVDIELDLGRLEAFDRRIADRGEDAAEVRVGGEERGLHERRMRDGIGDAAALVDIAAPLDCDGDELGRAFGVAHDRLREMARHLADRDLELETIAPRTGGRPLAPGRDPTPGA